MLSKVWLAPVAAVMLLASPAAAAQLINVPPPAGGVTLIDMQNVGILRINHQPVFTAAATNFVATSNATRFSFAMRADSSDFFDAHNVEHRTFNDVFIDDVQLVRIDPKTGLAISGNLVTNGDFEGPFTDPIHGLPDGWIFDQPDTAHGFGQVTQFTPIPQFPTIGPDGKPNINKSFHSTSNDEYNALSQTISTVVGATYNIQFIVAFTDNNSLDENGRDITNFQRIASIDPFGRQAPDGLDVVLSATNAGRGTHDDGHVHFSAVQGGAGVPEPATWTMLIAGLGGVGALARRDRRVRA